MACIKVDYEQMERTALVIEEYVECLTRRMEQVKGEVIDLEMAWQGTDADQFKMQFEKLDGNESVYSQTVEGLKAYSSFLRFAISKYKQVQCYHAGVSKPDQFIADTLMVAQSMLLSEQIAQKAQDEMKTTATAVLISEDTVYRGYIGDSRIYVFKKNKVKERTLDHSVPQMLVMAREIKEKDIRNHPDRNRLLKVKKRIFLIQPGDGNGMVYLNDELLMTFSEIKSRDIIQLGEAMFMFYPFCGPEFTWDDYIGK